MLKLWRVKKDTEQAYQLALTAQMAHECKAWVARASIYIDAQMSPIPDRVICQMPSLTLPISALVSQAVRAAYRGTTTREWVCIVH